MEVGNSQKSLQPFFAYGYCVLEGDACVDSSGIPYEKPNHASVTPQKYPRILYIYIYILGIN